MGAFKAYFVLLIILLACTACSQDENIKVINMTSNSVEKQIIIEHNETEEIVNSTREPANPYLDNNYSDVLNHSQLPTSGSNEIKRYRKYGTLVDLDNLTKDTCEQKLKSLENDIVDAADDINDAEDDVREAETYLDEQYYQKAKAVEDDDQDKIEDENEDIHDAEQWLWEEEQKLTQAKRSHKELEETIDAVDADCIRLGYDE